MISAPTSVLTSCVCPPFCCLYLNLMILYCNLLSVKTNQGCFGSWCYGSCRLLCGKIINAYVCVRVYVTKAHLNLDLNAMVLIFWILYLQFAPSLCLHIALNTHGFIYLFGSVSIISLSWCTLHQQFSAGPALLEHDNCSCWIDIVFVHPRLFVSPGLDHSNPSM